MTLREIGIWMLAIPACIVATLAAATYIFAFVMRFADDERKSAKVAIVAVAYIWFAIALIFL